MEILEVTSESVSVQSAPYVIRVGQYRNIMYSDAYMDIVPGTVRVERIARYEDVPREHAQAWHEAHISIPEVWNEWMKQPWIRYVYITGRSAGEVDWMPLEVFVDHTIGY